MQAAARLMCICALFILGSCGGDRVALTPLQPGDTVLAFGDSLTAGFGAAAQQSYPEVLENLALLNIINAGVSGELSAAGLQRLPALLAQHQPKLVIICHGGNDMLRSRGNNAAKNNILQMIALIREQAAEVLLLGVPRPGVFLSTADFYDEIAEETGVAYLPDLMQEVLGNASLKSDAVHPNAAGYQLIASDIHAYLLDAGAL